jgi:hypothetical protein
MMRHAVFSYGPGAPEPYTVPFVEQLVIGRRDAARCAVFASPLHSRSTVAPRHSLISSLKTCIKCGPRCSPD